MAGANNVSVVVTRQTGYPGFDEETPITPQCYATLVAAVLRADLKTSATHREERY